MSAERCPVCSAEKTKSRAGWDCGKDAGTVRFSGICSNAERLATEREKEINALHRRLAEARKIILAHVPDDIGPIAAMECGEWVKWCDEFLKSKGLGYE